ncbi:hypothetical protein CVIRNUC_005900 [Coccomyxa viridis]|uniref:BZIP domain-containing protein n=1 Tax=Coccomyxa viridis TaxID=1274662 RepID=A0AAV1I9J2_9CHLO|nr:hypothetical protein CVIRNUC_005900 [Coccomyxa viridis]
MSSSASGVQSNSTSGKLGNIFDDPDLVSSIMRMPSFPAQSRDAECGGPMALENLPPDPFVGRIQEPMIGIPGRALHKPESGDQSFMLEEETDLGVLRKRQALQEKSKKAQRRYRERKKAETEQLKLQIEELTGRMSDLMAERDKLQNRNSLLEKVVQVRSASDRAVQPQGSQPHGGGSMQISAQPQPEHVTATAMFLGLVYPGRGLEHTVRKEHMDNMTAADYLKVWKDYVSKLTHLLLALDGNDSSQARQQIHQLVEAQRWAVQAWCRMDMSKLINIVQDLNKDRQANVTPSSPVEARCLLDRLKLSREQKDHILSVRMRFLETMRHVMMQRRAAQEALELPLPAQYENEASLMHFAEVTLASEKSLLALCQQQKEAYRLIHYAVREVLTPVQDARLLVEAYPAGPDPVQLSTLVAQELNDSSADRAILGLPAAGLGGLPPPGLSALSALPYVPVPFEHSQPFSKADLLQDNTVTTGFL